MVGAQISIDEYLHTTYDPDCDYVDGEVIERNIGKKSHGKLQGEMWLFFRMRRDEWHAYAFIEQRVQVSPTRFRIPDVCVYIGGEPQEEVFHIPPFICIEILSPEDRFGRIQEKIDDYLNFGVPYVWTIDPRTRRAWTHTQEGSREVKDRVLRTEDPELAVPLAEIFAAIDKR